ncbi:hypothetical protein M5W70_19905 [Paenibacillus larvae]|uniref:Uncharacterized protein n=1 Tax=Paenibacillus larvae TaxID=1464 RepID=A0AAP5JY16_9BACL|nr:hypothetical protein [Paenibacillus larvae]MCY9690875.1 hypothetical protein [Paenibacillus larvae]MDT2253772.1 hypothetical protein [Paenibacillus larvae]MDV3485558.1 hypothetical protein [Paenibacillus larvae]
MLSINTIHSVKGKDFDSVMVVSSRRNSGSGHWKKWMEKELESARISYVANPAFVILTGQDWVIRLNRYHYFLGLPVQFALLWLFGVYE